MTKLTKLILIGGALIALVVIGFAVSQKPAVRSGELFSLTTITTDQNALDDNRVFGPATRTATSTSNTDKGEGVMTHLDGGTTGTTTLQLLSERANSIDLNIFAVATTVPAVLHLCNEFSNNGIDWYSEVGQQTNSTNEGIIGAPFCRQLTLETLGTTTLNVAITPVASKYTRVNFRATVQDIGVIMEAVLKELYN